jgi:hypothetical protein
MMQNRSSAATEAASAPVLDIDGARATIRLNRPKHLNRLQPEDLDALSKLFDRIEADPALRVLVLTGTGRAFSSGYDLGSIAERSAKALSRPRTGVRDRRQRQNLALPTSASSTAASRQTFDLALARFPYRRRWNVHAGGGSAALLQGGIERCVSRLSAISSIPDRGKNLRGEMRIGLHRDGARRGATGGGQLAGMLAANAPPRCAA